MRGLELNFENIISGKILKELIRNIKLEEYDWYFYEDEIYFDDFNAIISDNINLEVFRNNILKDDCSIIFINIQAFLKGKLVSDILTYEDFLNSECELILLIVDGYYVEIYCKQEELIEQFEKSVEKLQCRDIKRKTNENDGRTRMSF